MGREKRITMKKSTTHKSEEQRKRERESEVRGDFSM
jgi:hypothetical protein